MWENLVRTLEALFLCKTPEKPSNEIVFWKETFICAKFMYCICK